MNRAISFGVVGVAALCFVSAAGAVLPPCKGGVPVYFSQNKSLRNECKGPLNIILRRIQTTWPASGDKCKFDGKSTTWSSPNGEHVVLFDTHPRGYLEYFVPLGKHADGAKTAELARTAYTLKARLETYPFAKTHRYAEDLFMEFPEGVVQLSLNSNTPIPSIGRYLDAVENGYIRCTTK